MRIEVDPSGSDETLRREAIDSLHRNRIESKFLYVTERQAGLWKEVAACHSPPLFHPEFERIYDESFSRLMDRMPPRDLHLVGLGCGTGRKELNLLSRLRKTGRRVNFSVIDVSRDLVTEASLLLERAGGIHLGSLIGDLKKLDLRTHLDKWRDTPRIYTFFGLFPNLTPGEVARLFHSILRTGDSVVASVNLVPVSRENPDPAEAMRRIRSQYDNPETLAWLADAVSNWGLSHLVAPPEFKVGKVDDVAAFLAFSSWKTNQSFRRWGHRFVPSTEPLQLFFSLRYTPTGLEEKMRALRFRAQCLSLTSCGQEGIWWIRSWE